MFVIVENSGYDGEYIVPGKYSTAHEAFLDLANLYDDAEIEALHIRVARAVDYDPETGRVTEVHYEV